jgi:regulator of PEP synthase PpsR (kinase-PPPase family)
MQNRTVYFVSESTGITAETLGHSLISQFSQTITFRTIYMPFINSVKRANALIREFGAREEKDGVRPIVFATMADPEIRVLLKRSNCLYIELFDTFIGPLSKELGVNPSGKRGLSHGMINGDSYENRMSIINFAVVNDDGARLDKYDQADVILLGVSRSGKTPTCLYLAMHFGIKAANYPLTEEDFDRNELPEVLLRNKEKIVALTIDPGRLNRIREERRPGSRYASIARCHSEVRQAQLMFKRHKLRTLDTTSHSIEEVSSRIMKYLSAKI